MILGSRGHVYKSHMTNTPSFAADVLKNNQFKTNIYFVEMEICSPSLWFKASKWAKSKFEMGTASSFHSVNPALKSSRMSTPSLVIRTYWPGTIQWKSNWKTCPAFCQRLIKMSSHNHVDIELFLFFLSLSKNFLAETENWWEYKEYIEEGENYKENKLNT